LEARLASLEQASLIVDRQPQNDNKMISEGLPEVSVPAVDVTSQRESDSETLVTSLDSAILLNEKNGQGFSFPQSEISRDKKNTQVSENSNNSLSSKP
ncbi:15207_t:CDS:2, partial [Funneliformis caledonium]